MGAIARDGYVFELESNTINQTGAIHIYRDGHFIKEITYSYEGNQPSQEKIEETIDHFLDNL